MRFLLDENLPRLMAEMLRERGHAVLEAADSSLKSSDDLVIWQHAAREERVLITRDLDFPLRGVRPPPAGLVLIRAPDIYTAADLTRLLLDFLQGMNVEELLGNITVVAPGRARSRPLG